ncbi:hypothetical protein JYT16_00760 [Gemmatimonas aurantiaca]|nr:hypothetical protein [Gemmatimonas aurantiaca]
MNYPSWLVSALLGVMISLMSSLSPCLSYAGENSSFVLPDWLAKLTQAQMDTLFGLQSNEGVDIVGHDLPFPGSVWIGTTGGVSYSVDSGANWFTFNKTNGLNASNVSALFSRGDTIWVGTVTTELVGEDRVNFGAGLQFSADGGMTWESPADTNGVMNDGTVGPLKVTFDLASDGENVFSANFVGGLVGTGDNGVTWARFHLTPADAAWYDSPVGAPPLSSLYFSVVVDTAHTDTTIFWAGSACGIARYDFIDKHIKPSSNRIFDHAFDSATSYIYLAGGRGLSRGNAFNYTDWTSIFAEDGSGLPSNVVNEVHLFGGKLFVACLDTIDGDGVGFVWTDPDLLGSFFSIGGAGIDAVSSSQAGAAVHELISYSDQYLYLAGGTAGLFVSVDTGASWSAITTGAGGRGAVYSLAVDTLGALWCGTDSGLVTLYIDRTDQTGALVDSSKNVTMFDHSDSTNLAAGGSVRDIEIQMFPDTANLALIDSTIIWTANFPASDTGSYSVARLQQGITHPLTVDTNISRSSRVNQIASRGDLLYFAGKNGLRSVAYNTLTNSYQLNNISSMEDTSRTPRLTLPTLSARSIFMHDSITHVSADQYFAVTHKPTLFVKNWRIAVANTFAFTPDSLAHYRSTAYFVDNIQITDTVLPGAFVPAMGVQYGAYGVGSDPIIWAACKPGDIASSTIFCFDPIGDREVAIYDFNEPDSVRGWQILPEVTQNIWNFAFNGPEVFLASSEGLFYAESPTLPFTKIEIRSTRVDLDIRSDAEVNGVAVIGDFLWVTTNDGFAMAHIDSVTANYRIFAAEPPAEEEAYAYPTPFRPSEDGRLKFRYQMPAGASSSTIEVFDFAMNLVSLVSENIAHSGGEDVGGDSRETWLGSNDEGTPVVPGIYFFKVSFSNGESVWGKLALIP